MSTVARLLKPRPQRVLTPSERMQCLVAAAINEGRAEMCTPDQSTLRRVFEENAALLRSLAQ